MNIFKLALPKWILIFGVLSCVAPLLFYFSYFNGSVSREHNSWAEFGDFYGGFLGPPIALLAIIMLYYTLVTQIAEFKTSVTHLAETARVANEELTLSKVQVLDTEAISVLEKAEQQITMLIENEVSAPGSQTKLKIFHMCVEGRRFDNSSQWSDSYIQFIKIARSEGSVVWSYVHSLHELAENMLTILKEYKARHSDGFSSTIFYYYNRLRFVARLLCDTGFITEYKWNEIAIIAILHGAENDA